MIGTQRQPELLGQTVVVIGGTSGIGLETARRARVEGASVILTGRNPARLKQAALELHTERTAAFDANDSASLQSFFEDLSGPIDHVMVTAGAPHYGPALAMPAETARRNLTDHLLLAIEVARAGATHEYQGAGRPDLVGSGTCDLDREQKVISEIASCGLCRHCESWPVVGGARGNHYVVDRAGKILEERLKGGRIIGVKSCGAFCVQL